MELGTQLILENPTPRGLADEVARLLEASVSERDEPRTVESHHRMDQRLPQCALSDLESVRLKAGREDSPVIILLPPITGVGLMYQALTSLMPAACTVYTFNEMQVREDYGECLSLASLASAYCEGVISLVREGESVVLGGYSFGGVLAWEVCHQLSRRGVVIEGLVLLDSFSPQELLKKVREGVESSLVSEADYMLRFVARMSGVGTEEVAGSSGLGVDTATLVQRNLALMLEYVPQPLKEVRLLYVKASEGWWDVAFEPERFWVQQVGQDSLVRVVPGDHRTMMEGEGLRLISEYLDRFIQG